MVAVLTLAVDKTTVQPGGTVSFTFKISGGTPNVVGLTLALMARAKGVTAWSTIDSTTFNTDAAGSASLTIPMTVPVTQALGQFEVMARASYGTAYQDSNIVTITVSTEITPPPQVPWVPIGIATTVLVVTAIIVLR